MNKVILFGRLGKDPVLVNTSTVTASFPLCTQSGKDRVTWHNIKAFKETAESVLKHLTKGRQVLIEGCINNYQYEKDGQTRHGHEIIAHRIQFVSNREPARDDQHEETPF